jgi:hypothetical protein
MRMLGKIYKSCHFRIYAKILIGSLNSEAKINIGHNFIDWGMHS